MGRNAGWLTGAAALAQGEDCTGPDLIYLPELPFDVENSVKKYVIFCQRIIRSCRRIRGDPACVTEDMYANSDRALILSMHSDTNSSPEPQTTLRVT